MSNKDEIFSTEDMRLINLAQSIREKAITELTKENIIPKATADKELLTRCLDSLTGDVFKKVKMVNDKGIEDAQTQIAGNIAELLKRVTVTKQGASILHTPTLDNDIKVENPIDGETYIGINSESIKKEVLG